MSQILYILLAIVILGVIIMIHELGHYIVGRLCRIGIVEFAVGFGPKLCSFERKGIKYSLRVFPLGGFCRFVGEDETNRDPRAFNNAAVWKRFLTVLAGPAMNFLLAFLAAVVTLSVFGVSDVYPKIGEVNAGMPAEEVGLKSGDVITSVNGIPVEYSYDGVLALREAIRGSADTLELEIDRDGETVALTVVPVETESVDDEGNTVTVRQIGVMFTLEAHPITLGEALRGGGQYMWETTVSLFDFLRDLIFKGEGASDVTGPVGTVAVISEVVQSDLRLVWNILFLISLNLGIMNLLPLPALDGGRLVFLIVEGIRRKPIPPEKEGIVHAIGFLLFIVLAVVLLFHDISTYILK